MVLQRRTDSPVPRDAGYSVVIQIQVPPEGGMRELIVKTCAVFIDCGESIVSGDGDLNVQEVTCDSCLGCSVEGYMCFVDMFAFTAVYLYTRQVMILYVC